MPACNNSSIDGKELLNPDSLSFFNNNDGFTSKPVPAVVLNYTGRSQSPRPEVFKKLETVLLDLDDADDTTPRGMASLTLSFLMDRQRLPLPLAGGQPMDSLEASITVGEKDAKELMADIKSHQCFVFAVSTPEYQFRGLVKCGIKGTSLEQPVMEYRNLH